MVLAVAAWVVVNALAAALAVAAVAAVKALAAALAVAAWVAVKALAAALVVAVVAVVQLGGPWDVLFFPRGAGDHRHDGVYGRHPTFYASDLYVPSHRHSHRCRLSREAEKRSQNSPSDSVRDIYLNRLLHSIR